MGFLAKKFSGSKKKMTSDDGGGGDLGRKNNGKLIKFIAFAI